MVESASETVEETGRRSKLEPTPGNFLLLKKILQSKKRKKNKGSTKKHESVETISYVSIDVLGEKLDVDTATAEYLNYFIDTEWQEKEKIFLGQSNEYSYQKQI